MPILVPGSGFYISNVYPPLTLGFQFDGVSSWRELKCIKYLNLMYLSQHCNTTDLPLHLYVSGICESSDERFNVSLVLFFSIHITHNEPHFSFFFRRVVVIISPPFQVFILWVLLPSYQKCGKLVTTTNSSLSA